MAQPANNSIPTALLAPRDAGPDRSIELYGMDRERVDLVKRTIAKGTTDDELSLFLMTAQRMGLDPFAKQIYAVKRWDGKAKAEVMAIQVGIDGFRACASKTNECDGQEGPFWCADDGAWREAWLDDAAPAAAKVVVYRKGIARGFVGIATYRSYVQTKDGAPVAMWKNMPDVMLAKCAEALALRKAFPSELGGVHTEEEMGQADKDAPVTSIGKVPDLRATPPAPPAAPATEAIVDAEIVDEKQAARPVFDMAAAKLAIKHAQTEEALRALAPDLNKLGCTPEQAKELRQLGVERQADIRRAAAQAAPPSEPAAPAQDAGFAKFLADIEQAVGDNTAGWTEEQVGSCWEALLAFAQDADALDAQGLPWLTAANRRGGPIVLGLRTYLKTSFDKRRAELRKKQAVPA